ncbi:uncharacterized protein B0H18DRAFT_1029196, partial [Fomitopsis serialis]|uniref:uncharacterized protein n=1 Tax=Fomitopsis serialis TaxID=139415 RepID=UPI0020075C85
PSPVRQQSTTPTGNAFVEGNSVDSVDAHDVEFLLSGVASPTAPTPALPRFRMMTDRERRNAMTRLAQIPPRSSPFLRPLRRQLGNDRGSILSWEQLANKQNITGEEIPAPFRSGAVSPSPTLSAMPSPGGYGSISQVLLPDVTPSPAIHIKTDLFDVSGEASAEDNAGVTLLRLQLASVETKARDRLAEIESLESQLQTTKAARLRDTEELAKQVSELEARVHGNLYVDAERMEYITSLESQIHQAQAVREQAIQEALQQMQERVQVSHFAALSVQQQKMTAAWSSVRDVAEGELELIRSNRIHLPHQQLAYASA